MKKPETLIIYIFFLLLFACNPKVSQNQHKGIETLEEVNIGGVNQALLIRGNNPENPVLLRLHGGPGFPLMPYVPRKGKLKEIEKYYTVVYWEQRGTGKSYHNSIPDSSMNVQQFIDDTYEVVQYIENKLNVDKVYIWGHSWGSNLGILFSNKYPEEVHAYIGTGQSVFLEKNERNAYRFALQKAQEQSNEEALEELQAIDTCHYQLDDALKVRKWLYAFGGIVHKDAHKQNYVNNNTLKAIWKTPQYTFGDKINIMLHPLYSGKTLWEDMKEINLFQQVPEVDVPVYFMLGKYDEIVSHDLAAKYFKRLKAPKGKKLIWFEESAHRPFIEETSKFVNLLTERVLEETQPSYSNNNQHTSELTD